MMFCYCALLLLQLFSVGLSSAQDQIECYNVNTTTNKMVDSFGRERYFHGINVVVKGPPWIPNTQKFSSDWSFTDEDMKLLNELGVNVVRLGMMWPGAEPVKDQFNETYFNIAKDIVNKAANYSINILLDMHQDVLSARFCGEGIPDWTIDPEVAKNFPEPLSRPYIVDNVTGHPTSEDCAKHVWSQYYPTEATSAMFQQIYDNKNGLLDELKEFWVKVATEFKNFSNIVGYELINEPWAGGIYHDPLLLWPQVADKKNLAHVYDTLSTAIWDVDPCHNVFFESVTWDEWTVGFEAVPGGKGNEHRSVLSYHFYIPPDIKASLSFDYRMKDLKRLQCGGFLTEFSITSSNPSNVMDEADKRLQSWMAWDFKPYYDITGDSGSIWFRNGSINANVTALISRTYAQAVAGKTISMKYDSKTSTFALSYVVTESCSSTITEIYLNEAQHYPGGFEVTISPPDAATWNKEDTNYITVTHKSVPAGLIIQITVDRK